MLVCSTAECHQLTWLPNSLLNDPPLHLDMLDLSTFQAGHNRCPA